LSTAGPLHDPAADALPGSTTEVKTTTCYMCACRCGIRVHLRDSGDGPQVRYIEGNPEHPLNKGILCAKGSSGIMKQYSPARLTKPLMRRPGAARGDSQFVEVGWDEAFADIGERLRRVQREHGCDALAFCQGNPVMHNYGASIYAQSFLP